MSTTDAPTTGGQSRKGSPTGFPGDDNYDAGPDDLDAELSEALDRPEAEGWRPSVGEKLTGILVDIDTSDAGGYGAYPLLTIRKPSGQEVAVHCFHTTLKNRVESMLASGKLTEGSRVGIVYLGEVGGKPGTQPFHLYKLVVRPAA